MRFKLNDEKPYLYSWYWLPSLFIIFCVIVILLFEIIAVWCGLIVMFSAALVLVRSCVFGKINHADFNRFILFCFLVVVLCYLSYIWVKILNAKPHSTHTHMNTSQPHSDKCIVHRTYLRFVTIHTSEAMKSFIWELNLFDLTSIYVRLN